MLVGINNHYRVFVNSMISEQFLMCRGMRQLALSLSTSYYIDNGTLGGFVMSILNRTLLDYL